MDDATSRMKEAGVSEIIATNSVPNIFERVNLAPLLADAIINYPVINSSMGGRLS
jgi:phosphoribosylpyrophosphate synthetase